MIPERLGVLHGFKIEFSAGKSPSKFPGMLEMVIRFWRDLTADCADNANWWGGSPLLTGGRPKSVASSLRLERIGAQRRRYINKTALPFKGLPFNGLDSLFLQALNGRNQTELDREISR
jgi:hypothetical protein